MYSIWKTKTCVQSTAHEILPIANMELVSGADFTVHGTCIHKKKHNTRQYNHTWVDQQKKIFYFCFVPSTYALQALNHPQYMQSTVVWALKALVVFSQEFGEREMALLLTPRTLELLESRRSVLCQKFIWLRID